MAVKTLMVSSECARTIILGPMLQAQMCSHMQVHAWVTAMSLASERLPCWQTLKLHPHAAVPIRASKRPQTQSLGAPHQKLSSTPAAGKPGNSSKKTSAGRLSQQQQLMSVALHVNAASLVSNMAPTLQDRRQELLHEAQQAAAQFTIADIQHVLAMGTSGPVFQARYRHHALTML